MFLINSYRAQQELAHDAWNLPGYAGLKLIFSHFDGYSPLLDGSIRTTLVKPSDSEKSKNIVVAIDVKASSPSYKNNLRIHQQDNKISISTGGLSMLSYLTASRLVIDVTIELPRNTGDLEIQTLSLPVFIQAVDKGKDVVITSHSAPISVENVEARSLTVSSHSGSIVFEDSSKQHLDKFIKVSNSSGSTKLHSSLISPSVHAESLSGSVDLALATTATDLLVKNSSGSVGGGIEYAKDATSVSSFESSSGSLNVSMKGWTGFLTAESDSGSKNVGGNGLERWNDGWRKGTGPSTAGFISKSGSIKVRVL